MAQSDRHIAEGDRCPVCAGAGWKWWTAGTEGQEAKWIICRDCLGTGRRDQKGRKREKPPEAPSA
jgi:hypothetical protein